MSKHIRELRDTLVAAYGEVAASHIIEKHVQPMLADAFSEGRTDHRDTHPYDYAKSVIRMVTP